MEKANKTHKLVMSGAIRVRESPLENRMTRGLLLSSVSFIAACLMIRSCVHPRERALAKPEIFREGGGAESVEFPPANQESWHCVYFYLDFNHYIACFPVSKILNKLILPLNSHKAPFICAVRKVKKLKKREKTATQVFNKFLRTWNNLFTMFWESKIHVMSHLRRIF